MTQIITFVIFGGLGFMLLFVGAGQWLQQRRLLSRIVPIEAIITHSAVSSSTSANTDRRLLRSNSTTSHSPEIRFRYRFGGAEHESDLLRPTAIGVGYAAHDSAAEVIAPYPLGAKVGAFVNPAFPDKAFLIAEKGNGPIVFLVLGVILPPLAWVIGGLI